jgi:neutral ceramidase
MSIKAAFTEIDITPPPGVRKIGWLRLVVSDHVRDPLYARIAVFETSGSAIAFIQLDTLSIRWTQVADIRQRIAVTYGFEGRNIMVSATHNHAGPAVNGWPGFEREEDYIEEMVSKVVTGFGEALEGLQPAEIGFGSVFEFTLANNRRVIMRDGTVRTHGNFNSADSLCLEGPIDPEVTVIAVRNSGGEMLGALANYACHPVHHGPDGSLSAGWPGVFADEMKARGCPVPMFINGAAGNLHHSDPVTSTDKTMEEAGRILAEKVSEALALCEYRKSVELGSRTETVQLPFRDATDDEIKGTVRGAQRFVDPSLYDAAMPGILERIQRMGTQPAEVQVHSIDEFAIAGIPAEYFCELGLHIKEQAYPRRALIAGFTNGMIGYVPHREAFRRGGYETTFGPGSRLAPAAGDILAECALRLM